MSKEALHVGLSLTRVIIQEEPVPAMTWKVGERLLIDKRNCVTSLEVALQSSPDSMVWMHR